jgi:hypothetical protein
MQNSDIPNAIVDVAGPAVTFMYMPATPSKRCRFSVETNVNNYYTEILWAGYRSRYSDCLRAGRTGDRIPVGTRFSAPVQTGPEAHTASCTMGIGSLPGVRCGQGVTLTPHSLLMPRSEIE